MITSGAWRSAFFRPICSDAVSAPTSRWLTTERRLRKWNSIGSSMVRMWPDCSAVRGSSMAASVVDLPEPVAPTTRISPRFCSTSSASTGGSDRLASGGISSGM